MPKPVDATLTIEQFTDKERQVVGRLLQFIRKLRREGKLGIKAA